MSESSSAPEIRIDQLTGLRTLLAPGRAGRPGTLKPPESRPGTDPAQCPFCEGNEDRTPPEVDAIRPGGGAADGPGWLARTVPNLYPTLDQDADAGGTPAAETGMASAADPLRAATRGAEPDLFAALPAHGSHEVIVQGPGHKLSLTDLDDAEFAAAIEAWRERCAPTPRRPTST